MIKLGSYEKTIEVSPKLLIENERDWEHLPHVHKDLFSDISLLHAEKSGWKAEVTFSDGNKAQLHVVIKDDLLGWVQDTVIEGEIVGRTITELKELGENNTQVIVNFYSPESADLDKVATLTFYQTLYSSLLEEDEKKVLARAASISAGPAGRKLFKTVNLSDGSEHKMPLACPHKGLPLNCSPDEKGIVTCPWHGYQFDVRTGECVSGQIRGWRLPD